MSEIEKVEQYFGKDLPELYRLFLESHKSELKGDTCLYLASDLIERNECYQTKEYAEGYISIGDNSGGMAFIISLSNPNPEVFVVGHGSMDPDDKEAVCPSFREWQESGFHYE